MTPDELTNLLAQNEYLVLDISPEDFQELEKRGGMYPNHCSDMGIESALLATLTALGPGN